VARRLRLVRDREPGDVEQQGGQAEMWGSVLKAREVEEDPEEDERHGQRCRAGEQEYPAADLVEEQDGDDREDDVRDPDEERLRNRGLGLEAGEREDRGCVVDDGVDPDDLLEDREPEPVR